MYIINACVNVNPVLAWADPRNSDGVFVRIHTLSLALTIRIPPKDLYLYYVHVQNDVKKFFIFIFYI